MQNKRVVLVLKKQYKGQVVKKVIDKMGEITFDTRIVPQTEYADYVKMGFKECFDEVPQEEAPVEEVEALRAAMKAAPAKAEEGEEEEFEEEEEDELTAEELQERYEDRIKILTGLEFVKSEDEPVKYTKGESVIEDHEVEQMDEDAFEEFVKGSYVATTGEQTQTVVKDVKYYMNLDWAVVKELAAANGVKVVARKREAIAADLVALNLK